MTGRHDLPADLPAAVIGTPVALAPAAMLSFDVEDWYQGIEMPAASWARFEPRLERGLERILALLGEHRVTATFFVLGDIARRHAALIRRIADLGHEVATHGDLHEKVYDLDPERFRADLRRSVAAIEAATGRRVRGHRAPFFSITRQSLYALDILAEEGLAYDASIYPGANYRYGIPGYPDEVRRLPSGLLECPVSTFAVLGRTLGIGGAYLRLLPPGALAGAIRARLATSRPVGLYLHPWEFDPDHPRVRFRPLAMLTHYANLRSTEPKLRQLITEFRFVPYGRALGLS